MNTSMRNAPQSAAQQHCTGDHRQKNYFLKFGTNKVAVVMVLIEIMSKQVELSIEPGSLGKRA